MRDFLFRGKRIDNGEWVEGRAFAESIIPKGQMFYVNPKTNKIDDRDITCFRVIPESKGQFTGLNDVNGQKIFEGDIVKISGDLKGVYVCIWEDNNFEYEFNTKEMSFSIACVHSDDIEVIGNIHDNPELLGGVVE